MRFAVAAHLYGRMGARVVPLHSVSGGACSCAKGTDCPSAGKHPRIPDWVAQATSDTAQIAEWAGRWPDSNVGLAAGEEFWALDVDGERGAASLAALEAEHGPLPATPRAETGSGGAHYLFEPPDFAISNSASKVGPGLDVRGPGGQIVVAPSVTRAGRYRWIVPPWEVQPANAPTWLLELVRRAQAPQHPRLSLVPALPRLSFPPATPEDLAAAATALELHGPAIEGHGGDEHTFKAGAILTHDWALTDVEAWPLFCDWNDTCQPPWELTELRTKLNNGAKYGERPYGCARPISAHAFAKLEVGKWRAQGAREESIPALLEPICEFMRRGVSAHDRTAVEQFLNGETGWKARQLNLPRAVDPKEIAEREGRRAKFEGGDLALIDPKDPLPTARRFLRSQADAEGLSKLVRWQAGWWEARGTHYAPQTEELVRADLYAFAEGKRDVVSGAPIKPDRNLIETTQHALVAAASLNVKSAPAWRQREPGDHPADEILAFTNGLLHIPTRAFIPATRRFFGLNVVGFAFDQNAARPAQWIQFLEELWANDSESIETLQEFAGLALTGDTSFQKLFLLVGPKRSGKGTIARVLTELVGVDNVTAPTLNGIGQHFGLESLIAKQLAVISDARLSSRTDLGAVTENLLRISGEDTISVPRKHRDDWTAKLLTRFLVISNELPGFIDQSGALASRFIVFRLTQSFLGKEDRSLTQRLLSELPGILLWALDGLDRLRARGYFRQPAAALDMVKQLENLASPIKSFVAERCELSPSASVEISSLYTSWIGWCQEQGNERPGTKPMFGKHLSAAFPELKITQPRVNGARERHYEGITLLARAGTREDPLRDPSSDQFKEIT